MDEGRILRMERLEAMQKELQDQLAKARQEARDHGDQASRVRQELRDQMARSQAESRDQFAKLIELLAAKRKGATNITVSGEPQHNIISQVNPPNLPEYTQSQGMTRVGLPDSSNHPGQRGYPSSIAVEGHNGTFIPISHQKQAEFGFDPKATFTNPLFLDVDEPTSMDKLKIEDSQHEKLIEAHEKHVKHIEERLQAIEGKGPLNKLDAKELCLVPDLILPPKFKAPKFEKFDGSSCPKEHITMYCRMMTGLGDDDKLFIHCFQHSLAGSARRWYNRLTQSEAQSWKQLAQAFIEQYQYMSDMAPDRLALQNMKMKASESFKEYAQRWMDLASQVQPPLTKRERSMLFVDTLPEPYYEKLLVYSARDFVDIITSGKMIENALKSGRITTWETKSDPVDDETSTDGSSNREYSAYVQNFPVYSATPRLPHDHLTTYGLVIPQKGQQEGHNNKPRGKRSKNRTVPIPIPYAELLPHLLESNLLTALKQEPLQPPYPSWYDANESCDYHSSNPGHSIENCNELKYKVRDLVKAGILKFNGDEVVLLANDNEHE